MERRGREFVINELHPMPQRAEARVRSAASAFKE